MNIEEQTVLNAIQDLWDKPSSVQVELTQLLATGHPDTELPPALVERFFTHVIEEWGAVTTSAENNVLMALIDLTIHKGNRECAISPNDLWAVMSSNLNARVLEIIDEETNGGCAQEIHLNALEGMIAKGLVIRSFIESDWICSINLLWNPGFELIPVFKERAAQAAKASLVGPNNRGGCHV